MNHNLKTLPAFFKAVKRGEKTAELRNNDRCFQKGDILVLKEYDPKSATSHYSGEEITVEITHVLHGEKWGVRDGFAMLSFRKVKLAKTDNTDDGVMTSSKALKDGTEEGPNWDGSIWDCSDGDTRVLSKDSNGRWYFAYYGEPSGHLARWDTKEEVLKAYRSGLESWTPRHEHERIFEVGEKWSAKDGDVCTIQYNENGYFFTDISGNVRGGTHKTIEEFRNKAKLMGFKYISWQ